MIRATGKAVWCLLLLGVAPVPQAHAQSGENKVVEIESINVSGTRSPANSLIALSGIKPHDKVDALGVNTACHRISATGLFKTIEYSYDAYPDRPGVVLNLSVVDERPLLPASITPAADEEPLWTSLQALDPIFTRQLPPTEKALAFYAKAIEKCLQANGRPDEYAAPNVKADTTGKLVNIVFDIRKYKTRSAAK